MTNEFNISYNSAKTSIIKSLNNEIECYMQIESIKKIGLNLFNISFSLTTNKLYMFDLLIANNIGMGKNLEIDYNPLLFFGGFIIVNSEEKDQILSKFNCYRFDDYKLNNEWINISLLAGNENKTNSYVSTIYASNSPYKVYKKLLDFKFSKPTKKILNKKTPIANNVKNIDNIVQNSNKIESIKIYNIGQGSFSQLLFNHGKSLLFDVGFTTLENSDSNNIFINNIDYISKLMVNGVILSHYDLDHIAGSKFLDISNFKIPWYIPRFKKSMTDSSIKLLNTILFFGGSINIISTPLRYKHFLEIAPSNIRNIGSSGLVVKIEQENKNVLLNGDNNYNGFPTDYINSTYDFLLVSHHGSKYVRGMELIKSNKGGIAVISTGKNHFGHPTRKHIRTLIKNGFDYKLTYNYNCVEYKFF